MKPKVTLVNWTPMPMETIYVLWEASKVDAPPELDVNVANKTVPREKLEELFWQVLRQHIPIAEHIHFTFMLEGISVSLREQMVRHRIGTKVGDNIGVDIIPDLASSSWWSQSMRIQDMGTFSRREMYRVPESLAGKTVKSANARAKPFPHSNCFNEEQPASSVFHNTMAIIEDAYRALVDAGVPMEDARELIPLGAQHAISWDMNLQSLLHILGKRGCWILQMGIWGPIITGIIQELVSKIHPMFARIIAPPCIGPDGEFSACQYRLENARRLDQPDGSPAPDHHPPCPLWLCRDQNGGEQLDESIEHESMIPGGHESAIVFREQLLIEATPFETRKEALLTINNLVARTKEMRERAKDYAKVWNHDPYTWQPLEESK